MEMSTEWHFACVWFGILVHMAIFFWYLSFLLKLIGNSILGGLFILAINWSADIAGSSYSAELRRLCGYFRLPGAILLLILNNFL